MHAKHPLKSCFLSEAPFARAAYLCKLLPQEFPREPNDAPHVSVNGSELPLVPVPFKSKEDQWHVMMIPAALERVHYTRYLLPEVPYVPALEEVHEVLIPSAAQPAPVASYEPSVRR